MTDKEQIKEELEKNIKDRDTEEQKLLLSLCDEIFEEYRKESAKAVSSFLQSKINPLKSKFDHAHDKLLKKMGFYIGDT